MCCKPRSVIFLQKDRSNRRTDAFLVNNDVTTSSVTMALTKQLKLIECQAIGRRKLGATKFNEFTRSLKHRNEAMRATTGSAAKTSRAQGSGVYTELPHTGRSLGKQTDQAHSFNCGCTLRGMCHLKSPRLGAERPPCPQETTRAAMHRP
jgi:hypothetical protein